MLVFILPSFHSEPGLWQPFQTYLGKQFYRTSLETISQTKSHCRDFSIQIFFSFLVHHSTHFCTCRKNTLTLVFITYIYGLEVIASFSKVPSAKRESGEIVKSIYVTLPLPVYISKSFLNRLQRVPDLELKFKKTFKLFMYSDSAQF